MDLLSRKGAQVSHNGAANLRLGSGIAAVREYTVGRPVGNAQILIPRIWSPGGKRSDIDSEDLTQSIPEPRSRGCGVRPSASGLFFVFILALRRSLFWLFSTSGDPSQERSR